MYIYECQIIIYIFFKNLCSKKKSDQIDLKFKNLNSNSSQSRQVDRA